MEGLHLTSFFDRTLSIMDWCEKRRMPAEESCEILLQRYMQVQEYFALVEFKRRKPLLLKHTSDFLDLAEHFRISTEGHTFWQIGESVFRSAPQHFPSGSIYEVKLEGHRRGVWEIFYRFFNDLHTATHQIFRMGFSDLPDPGRRGKFVVRDSDQWLKERHPDAPK